MALGEGSRQIAQKVPTLVEVGLSAGDRNPNLFLFTIEALKSAGKEIRSAKGPVTPEIRQRVYTVVEKFLLGEISVIDQWYAIAEACVRLIFEAHSSPTEFMEQIILKFDDELEKKRRT